MMRDTLPSFLAAVVLGFGFAGFTPGVALCCSEPFKPSFYGHRPLKPEKPYCAESYRNTCTQSEVDSFNAEVDAYNAALQSYAVQVDEYVRKLKAYIQDTVDYAKCEAERVSSD